MLSSWRATRRLPWIRASDARDCGAAAFASLAAFYNHHLSLEQARELVETDRDGTSLLGMRDGGRRIGFDARPAEAIYDALQHLTLPAIAHLEDGDGHYVVLAHWSPARVTVLDPNRGVRRLDRAAFEQLWSGYVVEYRPTPALQPRQLDFRPRPIVAALLRPHRLALAIVLVCALLTASLGWVYSFYLQALIDRIAPARDDRLLFMFGAGLVAITLVQSLLFIGRPWLSARIGRGIYETYGTRYVEHLMMLPVRMFDTRYVAGLLMRLNQVETIQQSLTESVVTLVTDSLMVGVAFAIIAMYDPVIALMILIGTPFLLLGIRLFNHRVYDAQLQSMIKTDDLMTQLIGVFDGIRNIKIFSAEAPYLRFLRRHVQEVAAARYASRVTLLLPTLWSMLITSLIAVAVLWYSGAQVVAGLMTVGQLIVIFGMVTFYLNPVQRLPALVLDLRSALIGMQRLEEILALPGEAARASEPQPLAQVQGRIDFEHVSFAYKARRPVLRDISLTIHAGETVAIVGETGSGKSSLANLIAGFYLPNQGDVKIDGISTRAIAPEELRRAISAVLQGSLLFQQSIYDNITMLQEVTLARVEEVARQANAAPFIERLQKGYLTQVAQGGTNLSAGQAQRVALARALLKDAPILILDEATSNLDGITEQALLQALEQNRGKRTTIVIAHRLSTIRGADRIVVMHQGQIVEVGTHDSLMQHQGHYANLFRLQLAEPAAGKV
ncbi:MAG TPA: peptidase domain-containing ABC transporter [Roseiflexaceae bacterium]|nr:peptidase domain-containing ABC transporter [Roseiflexaceae bacterium]